ncbi:hypothetical protein E3N88_02094 [Mikania micrantha]|uniref:AAA+ ATPase domain-containing protein n=1 Tax=Mikania micrantha TaxID=192012 RepID=A0A5N6Q554_9ASTR|nr:hypothetical protein E3N88_02094 [Mikania micrantha]
MDSIISSIVTPVVGSLMAPIKKHLGFLISYTKHVTYMKEKMAQLSLTEQDTRHKWEEAVARNLEVSHHVSPWLEEVEKMNQKAQSIPTAGIGCFNMAKRYKVGKQSYNILVEIQALETWRSTFEFTNKQKPLAEVVTPPTRPFITDSTQNNDFESRDLIRKAALKSLQSNNNESHKMVALCGMGGVGKTTMMDHIKKDVEASKMFDRVLKVVLGENADIISLQRDIAEYINLEDIKEEAKDARADRLRSIFERMSQQGKKVLVIMDDIWKVFDLKDVGLSPLPNGFKLLFTSRDKSVCTQMGVRNDSIFDVGFLKYEEAKALFFRVVGLSDGDDPPLQKIGEDIVKKCGGLPIAIVTIAKSLTDNIQEAWKKTLWRLEKDDLKDLERITHRIFEMSYENLKDDNDRAIFLLSGLFPDDFDIRIEDLLRYGWGLDFFKDAKTLSMARGDTKIGVNNLLRANLLTKSDKVGCVKMHDLVRAFVLNKVSDVKQASFMNYHDDNNSDWYSCERILLKCTNMTEFPVDFTSYPNLSMLMLMDGNEHLKFPQDIYKRMEKLEVVSYEGMYVPPSLLTFQHSITKLRTLSLRSCRFINDDISFIGSLSNLETLTLVDCRIGRLPRVIGKLKRLKLLDLSGWVDLRIDDGLFENLAGLEELYLKHNPFLERPIRFTKANCEELEILSHGLFALEVELFENMVKPQNMSFKNLERFKISIGCKLKELEDGQGNALTNTIQLGCECNELSQCKINEIFNKTEGLHLQVNEMNQLEDILTQHQEPFSNLIVLHVSKCANLTYLFTVDVASGLKKLEQLIISDCPLMRTLIAVENGMVGVVKLTKLNFMSLTGLPEMESFWDNVIELPEMVELILGDLPKFTSIYPRVHNTSEMQSLLNKKVAIPRLERLYVSRMENLKHIWPRETVDENINASMLRFISVEECKNLRNLFPLNPLPLLKHLEELVVKECPSIEVLFHMELKSNNNYKSKLRSIKVHKLGSLKELWRMINVGHVLNKCDLQIKCFNGVESIKISNCEKFTNIFTPATCNFDLGALTKIIMRHVGAEDDQTNASISRGGEDISEMDEDVINPNYHACTYTWATCHQLQRLDLSFDKRVKEVLFEMDSTHQHFPYSLETLNLGGLHEMSHVWKCNNWNKFLIPQHQPALQLQLPFQNLTNISLLFCNRLKYLFSPLMVKYLINLKSLYIYVCDGIEEIISNRDDAADANEEENVASSTSSHQISTTLLFPQLNVLKLNGLPCLRSFDDAGDTIHHQSQLSGEVLINACRSSLCQYPRVISIWGCNAISVLIPWYAVGQMKRLEELEIWYCKTITKVFDEGSASGTTLTTPTVLLKTTNHVVHVPQLSNLKEVRISGCDLLSHVFTFSTLESLKQLNFLNVTCCNAIQEIVKQEIHETTSPKDDHVVVFPRLTTLRLEKLPNLKGFFLGKNKFRWPLLDTLFINDCPQLMTFTSGESETPKLKYISTGFGKYGLNDCGLNFHGKINEYTQTTFPASSSYVTDSKGTTFSFHNLIKIKISYQHFETLIPSNVLLQLQKLEKIHLRYCSEVKEVFEVVALEESGFNESQTTVVKIPNLKKMMLESVDDLKYLWKSNRSMVRLEFPNLTTVSIENCDSLEYVFTCSMVGSLVQLKDLHISGCEKIEVTVKEQEESEAKMTMLPRLKSLKLYNLESFKGFCLGKDNFSLPLLDSLQIQKCPAITVFTNGYLSTPELKVIDTSFGLYYVKPDLNSFIKTKQVEVCTN